MVDSFPELMIRCVFATRGPIGPDIAPLGYVLMLNFGPLPALIGKEDPSNTHIYYAAMRKMSNM